MYSREDRVGPTTRLLRFISGIKGTKSFEIEIRTLDGDPVVRIPKGPAARLMRVSDSCYQFALS